MIGKIPRLVGAMIAVTAILAIAASAASAAKIYNSIPMPVPGNVPSVGFQANQTSEFGGQVEFAGTKRKSESVTVLMSSWGCQEGSWTNDTCHTVGGATFAWPLTLNVYEVGPANSVGAQIGTVTQTFNIPFRPSANNGKCTGPNLGKWFHAGTCFNGKATKVTFNLTGVTLPSKAIVSVAYNTTNYGAAPVGPKPCNAFNPERCPYNSLNVGVREVGEGPPALGTDPFPSSTYINSTTAGNYCSNPGAVGTFGISEGCWTEEQPTFEVKAGN